MVIKQIDAFKKIVSQLTLIATIVLLTSCQTFDLSYLGFESEEDDETQAEQIAGSSSAKKVIAEQPKNWCFSMKVPDGNWSLRLDKLYQNTDGSYTALGRLWRHKGSGIQVIGRRTMCAPITIKQQDVAVIISGKNWEWRNSENATFVKQLPEMDATAVMVYQFDPSAPPIKPTPSGNPDQ